MSLFQGATPISLTPGVTPFSLAFTREMGTVILAVRGELDTSTCPELRRSLQDLIDDQGHLNVDLDLSGMEFIDSSGIQVLLDAHRRLEAKGGQLTLRSPNAPTRRVLGICGLDRVFTQIIA